MSLCRKCAQFSRQYCSRAGEENVRVHLWSWSCTGLGLALVPLSHYIIMTRDTGHRRRGTAEHSVWPQLAVLQDEEDKP